tara:strand:+ start:32367 stop:32534 length:168 start_codon:yes stop_codon:yes gene_type:complete
MHLGALLRREEYEDVLEDLCLEVANRLESNPEFKTKEIMELVETVEKMLEIVLED